MRPLAKTATALIAEAGAGIENLTPAQGAAEQRRRGVVLVDVREHDKMIRNGMLDGAIPVAHGLVEFVADPSQACHNPKPRAAARAILRCAAGDPSELARAR